MRGLPLILASAGHKLRFLVMIHSERFWLSFMLPLSVPIPFRHFNKSPVTPLFWQMQSTNSIVGLNTGILIFSFWLSRNFIRIVIIIIIITFAHLSPWLGSVNPSTVMLGWDAWNVSPTLLNMFIIIIINMTTITWCWARNKKWSTKRPARSTSPCKSNDEDIILTLLNHNRPWRPLKKSAFIPINFELDSEYSLGNFHFYT